MRPPRVLAIAGSDSGGGAGLQADLKTLLAYGVHGASAVTAVTVQNSLGVHSSYPIPPDVVRAQIRAVLDDLGADVVKIGMLGSAQTVAAVAEELIGFAGPIVVDPVAMASARGSTLPVNGARPDGARPEGARPEGARLLDADAVAVFIDVLLPLATVVTPNLDEVAMLTGLTVRSAEDVETAAAALLGLGPKWVLVTGGHLVGDPVDFLTDGPARYFFSAERHPSPHLHGTGCTLASALAAGLARGDDVPSAARAAKEFVGQAIAAGFPLGAGSGPIWQGWAQPTPRSR